MQNKSGTLWYSFSSAVEKVIYTTVLGLFLIDLFQKGDAVLRDWNATGFLFLMYFQTLLVNSE